MAQSKPGQKTYRMLTRAFAHVALLTAAGCAFAGLRQEGDLEPPPPPGPLFTPAPPPPPKPAPSRPEWPCENGGLPFVFEGDSALTFLGVSAQGVFNSDQTKMNEQWNEYYGRSLLLMQNEKNAAAFAEWLKPLEAVRNGTMEEKAAAVDDFVDKLVLYVDDKELYGKDDYWASPIETITASFRVKSEKCRKAKEKGKEGCGDCDDIANLKAAAMRHLGATEDQVFVMYVQKKTAKKGDDAHMFTVVDISEQSGAPRFAVLDNDEKEGYLAKESEKAHYIPYYAMNGKGFYAFPANSVPRWNAAPAAPTVCLPRPAVAP